MSPLGVAAHRENGGSDVENRRGENEKRAWCREERHGKVVEGQKKEEVGGGRWGNKKKKAFCHLFRGNKSRKNGREDGEWIRQVICTQAKTWWCLRVCMEVPLSRNECVSVVCLQMAIQSFCPAVWAWALPLLYLCSSSRPSVHHIGGNHRGLQQSHCFTRCPNRHSLIKTSSTVDRFVLPHSITQLQITAENNIFVCQAQWFTQVVFVWLLCNINLITFFLMHVFCFICPFIMMS